MILNLLGTRRARITPSWNDTAKTAPYLDNVQSIKTLLGWKGFAKKVNPN